MTELHRTKYPPPWTVDRDPDSGKWFVSRLDDEQGHIAELPGFLWEEAYAFADIWGWIERADNYERVLRVLALNDDIPVTVRSLAQLTLEREGRW